MAVSLEELAEDTLAHVLPQPGVDRIDRGDLIFYSTGNSASVSRVRLGDVDEAVAWARLQAHAHGCLLYTSPSPRDGLLSRMPSSA